MLIDMLSCHCYYVYPSYAATVNLACCPDLKSRSSGAKKTAVSVPAGFGKKP